MSEIYRPYSVRQALKSGHKYSLQTDFWSAFKAELTIMNEKGWFEHTLKITSKDNIFDTYSSERINIFLRKQSFEAHWPPLKPPEAYIYDYLEFFYLHIAEPQVIPGTSLAQVQRSYRADSAQGPYTETVNTIMKRLNLPYSFSNGTIQELSCKVLDEPIIAFEFKTADDELAQLIKDAVSAFYNPRENRKKGALKLIVDAFDKLKCGYSGQKTESVQLCIDQIIPHESLQQPYSRLFKAYSEIENPATDIRHSENVDSELTDGRTIEYLFYSYFNLVRLILQKQAEYRASESQS